MSNRAMKSIALAAILAAAGMSAWSASFKVESLELLTHGSYTNADGFSVNSRLFFDLGLEGGDKFAGLLRMDFLSSSIEQDLANAGLTLPDTATTAEIVDRLNRMVSPSFRTAAVTAKKLFGSPLEVTYFVGYLEAICSGDDFMPLFGSAPIGTALRGPMVFPDGIAEQPTLYYDGLDAIYGTGFKFGLVQDSYAAWLYAYQDSDLGAGNWTTNLRGLLDAGPLKLEGYVGASYASGTSYGLYRGGILFNYAPGKVGQFLAEIGMTRWAPPETLSIDNFFFLFEPRVNFAKGSLGITVFYHPEYFREKATGEQGSVDLDVDLRFGNLAEAGYQGGVATMISLRQYANVDGSFVVDTAPYFSLIDSGIEWSFKLDLRLFPFPAEWYGMFRPFIGVKTSY